MRTSLRAVAGLGLATIVAYGSWFYAYGALIDPIASDTGWRVGFLAGVYGAAQLGGSLLAIAGGRMLDRSGARPALAAGGAAGGLLIALAAGGGPLRFAIGYGVGGSLVGGVGFYHLTLAAAARFSSDRPERAVTAVTVLGALAAPIFLPFTAVLVEAQGWEHAVRILGIITAVGLTAAAVVVPAGGTAPGRSVHGSSTAVLRAAWAHGATRWKLVAAPVAALGYGTLLVHQVPVMVAAGLPLTAAATFAGARGFAQLAGRLALVPIVARTGTSRALVGTYLIGAGGAVVLAWSGSPAAAVAYTVLAGLAIGAAPPLDAIYSAELFDGAALGTLMGIQQLLSGIFLAIGPLAAGIVFDASGSHTFTIVLSAAGFAAAAAAIATAAAGRSPEAEAGRAHPIS
jgi:MFS family permease